MEISALRYIHIMSINFFYCEVMASGEEVTFRPPKNHVKNTLEVPSALSVVNNSDTPISDEPMMELE